MHQSRLWRATAVVAAACGLAGMGTAAAAVSPAAVTVTIATKSPLPKITGDTLVVFLGPRKTSMATVHGTVTGAADGDQAQLLKERFGATAFTPVGSPVTLHNSNGSAPYSFAVKPTLATRYEVQVTGSDITGPPPASARATVYVTPRAAVTGKRSCSRPACHVKLRIWVKVPTPAYGAEAAKHWYLYSRLKLAAHREPAPPTVLKLNTRATASKARKLHSYEFVVTVRYRFVIGNHAYRWRVNFCTKDSEHADGIGLPGRHACGHKWISATRTYLG
jgi:hypothetical protein